MLHYALKEKIEGGRRGRRGGKGRRPWHCEAGEGSRMWEELTSGAGLWAGGRERRGRWSWAAR
jgi:hypothetical protein